MVGSPNGTPVVSVIVPVRKNVEGIRTLLARLSAQTLPRDRFEVVIGDDGSHPGTLSAITPASGWVRLTRGPRLNSYAARNRAVAAAKGKVLAFCDSDCLPARDWLERGMAALETADVVAGE